MKAAVLGILMTMSARHMGQLMCDSSQVSMQVYVFLIVGLFFEYIGRLIRTESQKLPLKSQCKLAHDKLKIHFSKLSVTLDLRHIFIEDRHNNNMRSYNIGFSLQGTGYLLANS
uniref:Uncharacterized protein n=1 Tax=Solanum lycopersicum TaxID=4081 RepID=A0A3Q7ER04_SOLLC